MRFLALAITALTVGAASSARAQPEPVKAGVFRWADTRAADVARGRAERLVLTGSTLDLAMLEVRAITLAPKRSADTTAARDSLESFLLVKEGKLWATLNGVSRSLGAGGVALTLPGDHLV